MVTRKVWQVLAVGLLVTAGFAGRADAAPILSISPSAQVVDDDDIVSFDVRIDGLTEVIGLFEFGLTFNSSLLTGTGFDIAPEADNPMGASPDVVPPAGFTSPGFFTLSVLADFNADPADLATAQGTGFIAATLRFLANNNGSVAATSLLTIADAFLTDFDGTVLYCNDTSDPDCTPFTVTGGSITVNAAQTDPDPDPDPVPEPASLMLFGSGIAALVATRRRARRA